MYEELDYQKKLKIFHDNFVKYAWKYIKRQKAMEFGQEVVAITTPFKDNLFSYRLTPIMGIAADAALLINDLWNGRSSGTITASINKLFPLPDNGIKQMLSIAIQEITIHVESRLDQFQDHLAIGAFATDAVIKLISFIKSRDSDAIALTHEDIVRAILEQSSFFTNDNFFSKLKGDTAISSIRINTDIDSLRLDRHEEIIRRVEAICDKKHTSLQQQKSVGFYNVRYAVYNFVGRREYLKQIHDCFIKGKSVIKIVGGLGGMGKTQTALQYIEEHKAEYGYRVRWIDAESKDSLDASFREFAQELELFIDEKSDAEILRLVKSKLEKELEQTLLVFDNVENRDLVKQYLPNLGGAKKHHVLITTRNIRDYDKHSAHSGENIVALYPFSEEEALLYIRTILRNSDIIYTNEEAIELAKLFNNIPLGLSQSIAYIKNNLDSIQEYIDEYLKIKKQEIPIKLHDTEIEEEAGHVENIYTTLMISLKALSPMPKAVEMLRLCCFLYADSIPENLFDDLFDTAKEKKDAIAILKGYSLISVIEEDGIKFIYIHRLLQYVIIKTTDQSIYKIQEAIRLIKEQVVISSSDFKKILIKNQPMLLHILAVISNYNELLESSSIDSIIKDFTDHEVIKLYNACGNLYVVLAKYNDAMSVFKKSLAINNNNEVTFHQIGRVYHYQGKYGEALKNYKKALDIKKKIYGYDNLEVAQTLNNIAAIYKLQGKCVEALDNFQEALRIRKTAYKYDGRILNNIANLYYYQGKYDEAFKKQKESLQARKEMYGDNHPAVAQSLNNIAVIYYSQGEYRKALRNFEESFKLYEEIYGHDHPYVVDVSSNIANIYYSQGKYDEALEKSQEVLKIKKSIFNCYHPSIADTLNNIGVIYCSQGNYGIALDYSRESQKIYEEAYGHEHIDVTGALSNIANVYYSQSNYVGALEQYQEVLRIKMDTYNHCHPSIANTLNNIGVIYCSKGNYGIALDYYRKALKLYKQVYSIGHHSIIFTIRNIKILTQIINNNKVLLIEGNQNHINGYNTDIKLEHRSAVQVKNLETEDNRSFKVNGHNNILLPLFAIKEIIEALPAVEYLIKEILRIKYELPEFINNNYFKITMHYLVCNLGYLLSGKIDLLKTALPTSIFGAKVIVYEYLSKQKQIKLGLQGDIDNIITTPKVFIEKCWFDIAAQSAIGSIGGYITGFPIYYDIAISGAIGGLQCYDDYNQNKKSITDYSTIEVIIPYLVDLFSICMVTKNMKFDFSNQMGQMIAFKQSLMVVNAIVTTDYLSKLAINSCYDFIIDLTGEACQYFMNYDGIQDL